MVETTQARKHAPSASSSDVSPRGTRSSRRRSGGLMYRLRKGFRLWRLDRVLVVTLLAFGAVAFSYVLAQHLYSSVPTAPVEP